MRIKFLENVYREKLSLLSMVLSHSGNRHMASTSAMQGPTTSSSSVLLFPINKTIFWLCSYEFLICGSQIDLASATAGY